MAVGGATSRGGGLGGTDDVEIGEGGGEGSGQGSGTQRTQLHGVTTGRARGGASRVGGGVCLVCHTAGLVEGGRVNLHDPFPDLVLETMDVVSTEVSITAARDLSSQSEVGVVVFLDTVGLAQIAKLVACRGVRVRVSQNRLETSTELSPVLVTTIHVTRDSHLSIPHVASMTHQELHSIRDALRGGEVETNEGHNVRSA